jgi:hypothetical protein
MRSQLARSSQVQAARARLATRQGIPGGAPNANMAGCGYVGPAIGGAPVGVSPEIPAQALPYFNYGPSVINQPCVPCGVIAQADLAGETTVELATKGGTLFNASGVSSLNNAFEILLNAIATGSSQINVLPCGQVDAAIFNTDDCFCCLDAGCISTISPAEIRFEPFGTPSVAPFLSLHLWGQAVRGFDDCGYPYGIPVNGFFPTNPGFVGGVPSAPGGYGAWGYPPPGSPYGVGGGPGNGGMG